MRALVADDHELFRLGVSHLLAREFCDAEIVEAASLEEARACMRPPSPLDLLIFDLNMPGVDGVDSIAALGETCPDAKLVILSASEGRFEVGNALAAGIDGYVPKSLTAPEIAAALRQVMGGAIYVPLSVTKRISSYGSAPRNGGNDIFAAMTERQRHVLQELMRGKTSKEIGRALDIAEGTVKIHLAAIFKALGARTRNDAIARARALL